MHFSGHSCKRKHGVVHQITLWDPNYGQRSRGRPTRTFIDQLRYDTGSGKEIWIIEMIEKKKKKSEMLV